MTMPHDHSQSELDIIVFGRRAVLEALACESVDVSRVAYARDLPGPFRQDLTSACQRVGVEPHKTDAENVTRISGDRRNDQGVVASIRLRNVSDTATFIQSCKGRGAQQPTRLIALDAVTNPQNVGMILRSALAAGMRGMLWPVVGSPWVSGLVIKASAATVYRCPIVRCGTLEEGLHEFKRAGFRIIGLDAPSGSINVFEHAPPHRAIYVVGSEAEGLSQSTRDLLDEAVFIPMSGGVESLNAAVAAAVVCFAVGQFTQNT